MSVSIAQLNSNVFYGLGQPDTALCDVTDIHYAVRNAVILLTGLARASDNNQLLVVTEELTNLASPYDISLKIGMGTPAWVEVKKDEHWEVLQIVNKSLIDTCYQTSRRACAFYGIDDADQPTRYIEFSFDASNETFRIWFDKDGTAVTLATLISLPDDSAPLIELYAMQSVIPRIKRKLSEQIESDEMRKLLAPQIQTWNDLYLENEKQIPRFERLFRIWKNRSRSSQSSRRLPNKSGRGFYGG